MEKLMLRGLLGLCLVAFPFLFRGPKMRENLFIFFSKGVFSTVIDAYTVGTKRIEYPIRPFPKIFKTNLIYDLLFFPLLSVLWVKMSYNDRFGKILLKSLLISVPMTLGQWYLEKNSGLFKWKKWSVFHTFGSINFTLFLIRIFVAFLRRLDKLKAPY